MLWTRPEAQPVVMKPFTFTAWHFAEAVPQNRYFRPPNLSPRWQYGEIAFLCQPLEDRGWYRNKKLSEIGAIPAAQHRTAFWLLSSGLSIAVLLPHLHFDISAITDRTPPRGSVTSPTYRGITWK